MLAAFLIVHKIVKNRVKIDCWPDIGRLEYDTKNVYSEGGLVVGIAGTQNLYNQCLGSGLKIVKDTRTHTAILKRKSYPEISLKRMRPEKGVFFSERRKVLCVEFRGYDDFIRKNSQNLSISQRLFLYVRIHN